MVKEFIPESFDRNPQKNLNLAVENFKECEYNSCPDIEDDTYLATFLATWLSGRAFGDSSTSIRPKTF